MQFKHILLALVSGLTLGLAQKQATPPNVILILTDDQGYGDLGCHGNDNINTPELDRLHAESVRFTDFHVSPFCTPTRSALLTGRPSIKTGAFRTTGNRCTMHDSQRTIADLFAANGYRTGMMGKWHIGDNAPSRPQDKGFHEVLWHLAGGIGQAADYYGNDYFDDTYQRAGSINRNGKWEKAHGYCTDVWFQEGIEFIKRNREKPFFLYLSLNAPHGPYYVPEEWAAPYKGKKGIVNPNFYGMITNIDHNVGLLRKQLDELKLADNTILIFMTDNGTASGAKFEHTNSLPIRGYNAGLRGKKCSIYEGGHRVPFFIYWKQGGIVGGQDIDTLAQHIDVLPTLADLCGIKIPSEGYPIDGLALTPLLNGNKKAWSRTHIIEHLHGGPLGTTPLDTPFKYSCLLTEKWRYLESHDGKELYDIESDRGQQHNVISQHPEVVAQLDAYYKEYWEDVTPYLFKLPVIHIGEPHHNPTTLASQDMKRPNGSNTPHALKMLNRYPLLKYPWGVRVTTPGTYTFSLRQFTKEAAIPLKDIVSGRVEIAGITGTADAEPGSDSVVVTIDIPEAGEYDLYTYLKRTDGKEGSAYFVDVELVD